MRAGGPMCLAGNSASVPLLLLPNPAPHRKTTKRPDSSPKAQDLTYKVFKLWSLDTPVISLPPSPNLLLGGLRITWEHLAHWTWIFIWLNLPYWVGGETHYQGFKNTYQHEVQKNTLPKASDGHTERVETSTGLCCQVWISCHAFLSVRHYHE